jgi:hypothetical protein
MPKVGLAFGPKKESASAPEQTASAAAQPTANTQAAPVDNRPFTADQLRDAWVGLATTHSEEPRLKQLIENYIPQKKDEHTAEIQMPNPWQMDQMRKALPDLARQLRTVLHNSELKIHLVQAEYSQEQMAFTAEEKYKLMAEQNPALAQLKERLDLVVD